MSESFVVSEQVAESSSKAEQPSRSSSAAEQPSRSSFTAGPSSRSPLTSEQPPLLIPRFMPTFAEYVITLFYFRNAKKLLARTSPDAIYARMLKGTGCVNHADLSLLLGVSDEELADALLAEEFPEGWYQRLCARHSLSPHWLMFGVGKKDLLKDKTFLSDTSEDDTLEDVVLKKFCKLRMARVNSHAVVAIAGGIIARYKGAEPSADPKLQED